MIDRSTASFTFQTYPIDSYWYRIGDNSNVNGNGYSGTLTEILTIPSIIDSKHIQEVGTNAFRNCQTIKNLIIDEGIVTLENNSFRDLYSLQYVSLPSTLKKLNWNVFDDCSSLESVHINQPSKLEWIDNAAFSTCRVLKSFIIPPTMIYIANNAFEETGEQLTIYYCGARKFEGKMLFHHSVKIIVPKNGVREFGGVSTQVGLTPCNVWFVGTCKTSQNIYFRLCYFLIFIYDI